MSKPALVPLSADLIAVKGSAAPSPAKPRELTAAPPEVKAEAVKPAPVAEPKAKKAPAVEPIVAHNFRVKKSFKRAFDRAAFDEEKTGVDFLQHIFAAYQKHNKQ